MLTVSTQIRVLVRRHAVDDVRIGIETEAMTPWLVHLLRILGLEVVCLDARHARATTHVKVAVVFDLIEISWIPIQSGFEDSAEKLHGKVETNGGKMMEKVSPRSNLLP
jgi:hypothetical protein